MTVPPRVTVVIPTRNSARTIGACVASCVAQTVPVEIVVVDNASTDGTKEIARRSGAGTVFDFGPERSAQRNEGVRRATGEYVAVIDSDMVLGPRVVEACLVAMADPAVAGAVIPEESFGEGFWAACKALERSFYQGVPWMEAARFFRRADYLAAGGQDESISGPEDWDFSQRMEARGRIVRVAEVIRHDEGRLSLLGLLRKKAYYGRAFAAYDRMERHAAPRAQQTGVAARYALLFSRPRALLVHPLLAAGMVFMKTCEFAAGAWGYAFGRAARA
jgi:glycosyltransferase involved in cell wall biosynthesis